MSRTDGSGFEPPQMPSLPPSPGSASPEPATERPRPAEIADEVDTHGGRAHLPRRRVVLTGVIAVVVVAAVVVAGLVWGQGSPVTNPDPQPTPSATSAEFDPSSVTDGLPESFGTYNRKPSVATEAPLPEDDDLLTASATYTLNGVDSVLVILAGPSDDARSFLLSLGASNLREVETGWCATYDEVPICGVVSTDRVFAAAPLADQGDAELIDIARLAAEAG